MFDDQQHNDMDLMMKSILEGGQEEVPAHIWDGVSSGLDRIAQRRKAVIFWRRAAVGMSAAAAIAFGLFLAHPSQETDMESPVAEFIEPVSEQEVSVITEFPEERVLTAMAPEARTYRHTEVAVERQEEAVTASAEEVENIEQESAAIDKKTVTETVEMENAETESVEKEAAETDNWIEEESGLREKKADLSLVLSGIAGTNSAQNVARTGVIRRPTLSTAPIKTGVTQTEPGDTYGIPLSFGIGTKIGFSSRWSLGVGLNYTLLSRKFYGDYTKVEGGQITESLRSDIRNTQHYIGIPVNAYYDIVDKNFINFYAYAGGTVEKCLSDEYKISAKNIIHKESAKGVQLSANLGIGVEFMLGKHLGIYLDPSVRYYFNCNQPKSIRTAQPLMLGFEMGLRARL